MDLDKIFSRVALAVPTTHIIACSLYLVGYSWGFGENIETLFVPSDFFRISMQRLAMMYVVSLGFPVGLIFYRYRVGLSSRADAIERIPDQTERDQARQRHEESRSKIAYISPIIASIFLIGLILTHEFSLQPEYYITISLIETAMLPTYITLANKAGFEGKGVEVSFAVLVFFTGVISIGLDAGTRDRHAQYAGQKHGYTCGTSRIVNAVGERFVAVSPNNQLNIIDDECKSVFAFRKIEPFRPGSLIPLLWRMAGDWLTSKSSSQPDEQVDSENKGSDGESAATKSRHNPDRNSEEKRKA